MLLILITDVYLHRRTSLRTKPYWLFIIVALTLVSAAAYGQSDQGRIGGVVKDPTGAVIPGVTVVVTNDRTGQSQETLTGDTGQYLVAGLRPSTYRVKASLAGFAPAEAAGIELVVGQKANIDITLRPASITTDVDVVAAIGDVAVDTSSATIGINVVPREVQALPLNGRQVSQLYLQAPAQPMPVRALLDRFGLPAARRNKTASDTMASKAPAESMPIPARSMQKLIHRSAYSQALKTCGSSALNRATTPQSSGPEQVGKSAW